jgi:hypothetical protein
MSCERWNEPLVGHAYGELSAREEAELQDHLASCARCREQSEELTAARRLLREAEPEVPATPRVVVLAPQGRQRWWLPFAAGLACAAILVGSGMAAGWTIASKPGTDLPLVATDTPAVPPDTMVVVPAEYESRLEDLRRRVDDYGTTIQTLRGFPVEQTLTRNEFESSLARFERETARNQEVALKLLLAEIGGVEARTDARIGVMNEALRYVVLASDPSLSEQ